MKYRLGACALVLALAACSRGDGVAESGLANGNATRQPAGSLMKQAQPMARVSIASAPDRGALISYPDHGKPARREGAHTWYPAKISEAHAFNAIASGEMTLPLPDGSELKLKHERHPEGSDGNWTWIGRVEGGDPGQEAIITFGDKAVYGSIPQADGKPPLEIRTQGGSLWVVQADPSLLKKPNIGDRDMKLPPSRSGRQSAAAQTSTKASAASIPMAAAAAATGSTVDVVIGYTPGFRNARGGQSQAVTRLNYLVEVGNQAYSNSGVSGQLRLVGTVEVNYADNTDNETALEQLTGNSGSGSVTVPASLKPIRDAREQYGADIAFLVRKFQTPENDGCGIAWLNGGNGTTIDPALDDDFGFGVVSDGTDAGTDGKTYFCADETLVHEASHLMGSAHDVDNAGGTQGAFPYSYGYKSSASSGNFYTVMAYGDSDQKSYRAFSNPSITFCGGRACGVANQSDNARSLNATFSLIAAFRKSNVEKKPDLDLNGDGKSDLLWLKDSTSSSTFQYWFMDGVMRTGLGSDSVDSGARLAATGDFNGDGILDLVWDLTRSRVIQIWLGAASGSYTKKNLSTYVSGWKLVAAGDVDGDGKSDLLWRVGTASTDNFQYWLMDGTTRLATVKMTVGLSYQFAASGDFNGDGRLDVLWDAPSASKLVMSLSESSGLRHYAVTTYAAGWSLVGVGDVDGDGKDDLLWRYHTYRANNFQFWMMNGSKRTSISQGTISSSNKIAATGDYNGDGRVDIVWDAPSVNSLAIWMSKGSGSYESLRLAGYSEGWRILDPGL